MNKSPVNHPEDPRVTNDDDDARHQKCDDEKCSLRRASIFVYVDWTTSEFTIVSEFS